MIGVVDMDMGNLRSVSNAIYQSGFDPQVVKSPDELKSCTHLVLPGVGSYFVAMEQLLRRNLFNPIKEFAASGRPLMGICLGMEILSSWGDEGGEAAGLNLIPGKIERLNPGMGIPIPHVGWNDIQKKQDHFIFKDVENGVDFYFVHSYHYVCESESDVVATTQYGVEFSCVVGRENIIATQFHPEKSQANGLRIIENFCEWDGNSQK